MQPPDAKLASVYKNYYEKLVIQAAAANKIQAMTH